LRLSLRRLDALQHRIRIAAPRDAITDSVIEVSIKMMADQVVALESAVAAPAGAKGSLAAHAAERSGNVTALAALQQHHDDQEKTDNDVKIVIRITMRPYLSRI
jgi:hypothetical protein